MMNDINKIFPDEEMYNEFVAFQNMDEDRRKVFAQKNAMRFNALSPEEQEKEIQNLKSGIENATKLADEIIIYDLLGELPENVSFSKIAGKYFGKSSGWLYHRLKGTLINGKPAKFTTEQKLKLADAFAQLADEFNKASRLLHSTS